MRRVVIWATLMFLGAEARAKIPSPPQDIQVQIRDTAGQPLVGAKLEITMTSPGNSPWVRSLSMGNISDTTLAAPFMYEPGDLQDTDCTHTTRVSRLTVRASLNGVVSKDLGTIDSCTYLQRARAGSTKMVATFVFRFEVDKIAPVTTFWSSPTLPGVEYKLGKAGQEKGSVRYEPETAKGKKVFATVVELTCTDGGPGFSSGCARIEYQIDGGPKATYLKDHFFVANDKRHTVTLQAIDAAGNAEAVRTFTFDKGVVKEKKR